MMACSAALGFGDGGPLTWLAAVLNVRLNVGAWAPFQAGRLPFIGVHVLDQWHLPVTFRRGEGGAAWTSLTQRVALA